MKRITILLFTILLIWGCKPSQLSDYQLGVEKPNIHACVSHNHLNNNYLDYKPNEKIFIVGVGDVSLSKLYYTEEVIKTFYKFKTTVITNHNDVEPTLFYDKSKQIIDCDKFVRNYEWEHRVIYVTDKPLRGNVNPSVRGYTLLKGKIIIVNDGEHMKETIIHEIGHTYGLNHCENLYCVMGVFNDEYDTGTFCYNCKSNINYK